MLWLRADLEAAGGIRALSAEAAEDAASTKIVRAAGLRVRLVDGPFEQPPGQRSLKEVWRRQTRWARLLRAGFPLLFLVEIFGGAVLPLAAAGYAAQGAGPSVESSRRSRLPGMASRRRWYGRCAGISCRCFRRHQDHCTPLQASGVLGAIWFSIPTSN